MRRSVPNLVVTFFGLWLAQEAHAATPAAIIPQPMHVEMHEGVFNITPQTKIDADPTFAAEAKFLAGILDQTAVGASSTPPDAGVVLKKLPATEELGEEGYRLTITAGGVCIEATTPAGAFYGCQTLRQLLPPDIENATPAQTATWSVPQLQMVDRPRFPWRGMMLDSARHFQSKEIVERYIDLLAYHKMNRLHWHLIDDQGWRVEIKKYPRLTDVGAWRPNRDAQANRLPNANDEHYGGFYTQDDLREIVAYAAARHVLIVPEIELPGHCLAMIAAYPELCCTGNPSPLGGTWRTHDVCCPGNERVFEFLDDVLMELTVLFPSPWIHVGGDECPKDRWKACPKCQARMKAEHLANEEELQSYFIRRMEKIVESKGRRLIGWDEILEGGLAPNAAVQSWRNMAGGLTAARQGHDVVMSPTSHCYLDYSHDTTSTRKSYSFEPVPAELDPALVKHVLGIEGCMWLGNVSRRWLLRTGSVMPVEGIDVQVFPRLAALAEVGWSPKDARNWDDFRSRLVIHAERLQRQGVQVTRDPSVWENASPK